jgi:hypothetical protein
MAVNRGLGTKVFRRDHLQRLHLFADDDMPDFIKRNIGHQLEQVQSVPRKSTDYSAEERVNFPRLVEKQPNHLKDWEAPITPIETYSDTPAAS